MKKEVGGGEYYYLYNGHGDVIQIVDRNGNVVNNYKYDEWGNILESNETIHNPFKYAGEIFDEETGLYYLRARYYDPTIGRFINEDTYEGQINNPLSLNLYSYCYNNPLMYVDPSGNIPFLLVTGLIGAALGAVGGAIYSAVKNKGEVKLKDVLVGAAIGGAIGLTGGAAASLISTAGATAFASTGTVWGAIAYTTTTAGVALGTQFGKLGELVKNPNIKVDWLNTTRHAQERMLERGVTQKMVETWMKTGQVLKQSGDKFLYITRQGAVVIDKLGKVITAYTKEYFDENMIKIVDELFK